jgi:single-strand DNA-binding protein
MANINKVLLMGNLTRDAEVVQVGNYMVLRFSIATTRKWTDSHKQKKEETEFHSVERWGSEGVAPFLLKGACVFIEGRLKTDRYKKRDDSSAEKTKVVADTITIVKFKNSGDRQEQGVVEAGTEYVEEAPF